MLTQGKAVARPRSFRGSVWGLNGNPTCYRYDFHFARGQCYAHGNICKLRGWFGNSWKGQSWFWPQSVLPLVRFLFFVLSAMLWGMESFHFAVPLRSGRIEFLRWGDGSKTRERTLALWKIFGWSVSALPDFSGFMDFWGFPWLRFTDCGLQATVYVN